MHHESDLTDLLAGCERQVLHTTDKIQPFACLLHCDADYRITHVSMNAGEYFDTSPEHLLHQKLTQWLPTEVVEDLCQGQSGYVEGRIGSRRYDLIAQASGNGWTIEANPFTSAGKLVASGIEYTLLKNTTDSLSLELCLQELVKAILDAIHFDHVTVYRFSEDWSGEVIAEGGNDKLPNYMGLNFPASDIPEAARELYMIHPWRLIPDVNAPPIDLLSHEVDKTLDLSRCDARYVAPVHLEYLRNMGVRASFSMSIIVRNQLWGLIACHHSEPHYLGYPLRRICHAITRGFVMYLLNLQASERIMLVDSIDRKMEYLTARLSILQQEDDVLSAELVQELQQLVHADASFFVSSNGLRTFNSDLSEHELFFIDKWFMGYNEEVFATDQIHSFCPWLQVSPQQLCGLLAIRVPYRNQAGDNEWLRFFWLRKEQIQHVKWAGQPTKEASLDSESGMLYLSPRRSFAEWQEIKRGFSKPWSSSELFTVKKFRGAVLRWIEKLK